MTIRPLLWIRWLMLERRYYSWKAFKLDEDARVRGKQLASKYAHEGYRYPHLKAFIETRDQQ